jgi:NADH-quinone oxidoreductase subunit N
MGTLIVFLQAHSWMTGPLTLRRRSEFYILLMSTLLGMYFMISSGNFLMLYIGLELASIPVAAAAAYDKFRMDSAESGMKYILSSAVSSVFCFTGFPSYTCHGLSLI